MALKDLGIIDLVKRAEQNRQETPAVDFGEIEEGEETLDIEMDQRQKSLAWVLAGLRSEAIDMSEELAAAEKTGEISLKELAAAKEKLESATELHSLLGRIFWRNLHEDPRFLPYKNVSLCLRAEGVIVQPPPVKAIGDILRERFDLACLVRGPKEG